jgi:hypothetical protein
MLLDIDIIGEGRQVSGSPFFYCISHFKKVYYGYTMDITTKILKVQG